MTSTLFENISEHAAWALPVELQPDIAGRNRPKRGPVYIPIR